MDLLRVVKLKLVDKMYLTEKKLILIGSKDRVGENGNLMVKKKDESSGLLL